MEKQIEELRGLVAGSFEELKAAGDKAEAETRKNGEATAETRSLVDKINDSITAMQTQVAELEARAQRPAGEGETADANPEKELRKAAFERFMRHGAGEQNRMTPEEQRALSTVAADGGFLIPEDMESDIIMAAYNLAGFRPVAQVRTTGRDAVRLGGLTQPTVAWGKGPVTPSAVSGLNQANIVIEDLKTLILVHNNILDDAEADLGSELTQAASRAIADAEDVAFAVGTGAVGEQPSGFAVDAGLIAAAQVGTVVGGVALDDLINMMASVKAVYRRNGTFMMNSLTEAKIRLLKDTVGQYLWQPSVQAGQAATLLGRPIGIDEGMASVATGAEALAFGDFVAGYRIYDRAGITVKRLDERWADADQTGFIVKKRVGGGVVLPEAIKLYTVG